ncbi:MAG: gliding motility-associated C-terminal domain-containing protein, partial [Dehalococcoidales bacterium]|nr:gliding motility-associated C-terminal domain-containing protein [Dehalococcoidales bacterium]
GSGNEITPSCSAMPTKCMGGSLYGVREHVFQAQVTLPPCNYWKIFYPGTGTFCCRNPSNTIVNSSSQGGYIEATLNNLQAPCNSSPTFTNKPITMMCVGQTQCYNHGAVDPDGDSLVYSMVTPQNGNGTYVSWVVPYSATQPLPSNPPITIDPVTGDICMTPTMNIISPMAVKVEQWRTINGVPTLIGTIFRDLQVNVVACNNQIPKLGGMDTTKTHGYSVNDTTYAVELCLGKSISFAMWGHDADVYNPSVLGSPEKFSITWNNGIPWGTFQTFYQNTDSAYATFSWTPNASHVSNVPKCFTATVKDGACPFNGQQTFSYCITVRGMSVNIGHDTLLCKGESVTFSAVADTTTVNYIWKLDGIPTGVPLSSTSYTLNSTNLSPGVHIVSIETNDGGTTIQCPGIDQATVTVVPLPKPDLGNDTLVCEPKTITLDAGPGALFLWSTGATTQTITVSTTATYTVMVDGGNGTRCTGSDEIYVEIVPIPLVELGNDTCAKTPFVVSSGVDNAHYTWSNGATTKEITPSQSGTYSVTVTYKPGSGCEASDTRVVNIIDFNLGPDTTICTHETVTLAAPAPPAGHTYTYYWLPDGQTTREIVVADKDVGEYIYSVDVGGGCYAEVLVTVIACPITIPNVFTPNGDGANDNFNIDGVDNYPGSRVVIYNRWGIKVFESDNYNSSSFWDAKNNSDGVYFYILYLKNRRKGEMEFKEYSGSVTVLRGK